MELFNGKCDCGSTYSVSLADAGRGVAKCKRGHTVTIKTEDNGRGARKAQKAMDDLDKALKKFGR